MPVWNPWHGCIKVSEGCKNCYMYRRDAEFGKDSSKVTKTQQFRLPLQKSRNGMYKLYTDEYVYTCMTSDFFIEQADDWRKDAWKFIKLRSEIKFYIITKRIERFYTSLPADWGEGYENVTVCVTCENQRTADKRIPFFLSLPIKHREIIHEPMLESIDIRKYLSSGKIDKVICGGESGEDGTRVCDYEWIKNARKQCDEFNVPFLFRQTGTIFRKDGKLYRIPRQIQASQAEKSGISTDNQ